MSYLVGSGVNMAYLDFFNMLSPREEVPKRRVYLGTHQNVAIEQGLSVDSPRFRLSGGIIPPNCNYVYCDKFSRYYYVDDVIAGANDTYTLVCSSDPMMSFWDKLSSNQFLVDRQEYAYNNLLEDPQVVTEVGAQITKKIIGNVGKTISYVLTVAGGSE